MRVLITGGTGFVGANLARRLVADGHQVHLILRAQHKAWRIKELDGQVRLWITDLADEQQAFDTVREIRPDWIFHLAAHGAYPTQTDVREMVKTNLLSTINLLEAAFASGFDSFIHTGSSSEYGFKSSAPAETECPEPNSYYAVTKTSASMYCQHMGRSRNARIFTVRLYSVYGAYEEPTRLMPVLITKGLKGQMPPLVNPDTARDYIYVDDVTDACVRLAQCRDAEPGDIFNLGTGRQTDLRSVVETARSVLNITAEPQWGAMPARIWDTNTWVSDSRKIMAVLKWQPQFSFEQGFRAMVEWFRATPQMCEFYKKARG